ncbi:MAG TPA: 7TM diverse intracellular signaling domain-containing protein, partial [Pseudomonadales bacterium]|nr:7TM diverse intracellular signaling domain-containing protein [Pseudomonadales bacterium]
MRASIKRYLKILLIQVITLLLSANAAVAGDDLTLNPNVSELNVAPYLAQLKEPDVATNWTLEEALQRPASEWQPVTGDVPSYGFVHEGYWFRLQVKPEQAADIDGLISVSYPALDHLEVYRLESGRFISNAPEYVLGDLRPFYPRYANNRDFLIPVKFKSTEPVTFLFRAKTDGTMQLPIKYYSRQSYYDGEQKTLVLQGFYFGILFIMAAYNFFISTTLRDLSYFFYSAFVFSILLFQSSLHGFAFQFLWPEVPAINEFMIPLSVAGCVTFGCLFSMYFLKTRKDFPRLNGLFRILVLAGSAVAVASLTMHYSLSIKLAALISLAAAAYAIGSGAYCWFKGVTHARYYFWGWTVMLGAVVILNLNKQGILPANLFTEYAMQIGSVFEVVLLSFALGDRINSERKAKQAAQNKALQQEREARQAQERQHAAELAAQQKVFTAQAESKAKSQFLATMSHEIRTPMNGVIGMSELLKETPLLPQQRNYVDIIIQSGKALLTVINDILDFSKIEAGKMGLDIIEFDVEKLCFECASVFRLVAERNQIDFFVSMDPDVPTRISSDPSRIRQLLLNLLGNAFKFTPNGSVMLRVRPAEGENRLHFEVVDTGIGISEEQKEKLFQA